MRTNNKEIKIKEMIITRQDCMAYQANNNATRWDILVRLNGKGTTGIKMFLEGIKAPDRDKAIDKVMRILNDITMYDSEGEEIN